MSVCIYVRKFNTIVPDAPDDPLQNEFAGHVQKSSSAFEGKLELNSLTPNVSSNYLVVKSLH